MQSDKVLLDAMPPEPEADVGGWDLDMFRDPADLDYNQVVLAGTATPLTEAIRREGRRAVTLMELMDAFDEARRESEIQLQLNALREQAIRKFAPNFHRKVHGEDLTDDIALTWHRLAQFNGEPIPLRQLTAGDVWDEVTVFMSLLFLAHLEKGKLWQKDFPYGEIYVKRLSMTAELQMRSSSRSPPSVRNPRSPRRWSIEGAGPRGGRVVQRGPRPDDRRAGPDHAPRTGGDQARPARARERLHEARECDRGRSDRDQVDHANPLGVLGAGPRVRTPGDRSGHPEDGRPHRLPSADPAERSLRHDWIEGLRAHERPRGARPHLPQAFRAVVRPGDDAVLRGVLRAQIDGPRRDPPHDGPEGRRALHGAEHDGAVGRSGLRGTAPGFAGRGCRVPPGRLAHCHGERVTRAIETVGRGASRRPLHPG